MNGNLIYYIGIYGYVGVIAIIYVLLIGSCAWTAWQVADAAGRFRVWRTTRALLKARDEAITAGREDGLIAALEPDRTGAVIDHATYDVVTEATSRVKRPTAYLAAQGTSLKDALATGAARFLFRDEQPEPLPSDTVLLDRVHDQSRRDILREQALATVAREQARDREIDAIMARRNAS